MRNVLSKLQALTTIVLCALLVICGVYETRAQTSFTSSGITINDNSNASPYPSDITVSGLTGVISKVTVSVNNLSHTNPSNLDMLLVAPGGQAFIIMSDAGGTSAVSGINLTLDETAGSQLSSSSLPPGIYRPADYSTLPTDNFTSPAPTSLNSPGPTGVSTFNSVFNGTSPNGTWSLYVVDDETPGGGTIGSWTLTLMTICSNNPIVTNNNNSGPGSLRQAVIDACPGSTITFAGSVTTPISLSDGQIIIDKNLTIQGPGANLLTVQNTAAASATSRVFVVSSGVTATISGLTISGGNLSSGDGGGIYNLGTLTITNSTVSNNSASSGSGGGIFNLGKLTVTNSTVSNNSAGLGGGGILNLGGFLMFTLTNSTISGNITSNSDGGGITNGGLITITNSTISNNAAPNGGGISQNGGQMNSRNSIIAGNTASFSGPDFQGTLNSEGHNLVGNTSGTIISGGSNDILNMNPLLGPLADNGGPTKTHALLPGSPAINTGTNTGAPPTDQRGITRPQQTTVDIGAFESRGFTMQVSGGNNQSTFISTAFANPLAVSVTSVFGEPVDNGKVTFTPPASGASSTIVGNPATIISGIATTGTVTANATVGGPYTVTAYASGVSSSVNFSLKNTIITPPDLTINDVTQNELNSGTSVFTFTVSLDIPAPVGGITFDIATADGTTNPATQPSDYAMKSLTGQTITEGNSTYTFSVTVNGDLAFEPDETFFVNVTNVVGVTVSDGQGLGTITNDELPTNPTGIGAATPSTVSAGETVLLTVTVTPGINPASTGLAVTGDLSSIGGSATQQFYDNGTNGDVTAGDNIFSYNATVSIFTIMGQITIPSSITDAQSRSSNPTISFSVDPPVPVELTSFTARLSGRSIELNWQTATEVNNYGFEIERSLTQTLSQGAGSNKWEKIGFVPGNGNSNSPKYYSITDINPNGGSKFIYRLKQIDGDGKFEYSDEVEVELVPNEFAVFQNYPNPFNPSTVINYSLPTASNVKLEVFNIAGEKVATLVDGFKSEGSYEVSFDASSLPSGLYLYRISAGAFLQTRKMLLMK